MGKAVAAPRRASAAIPLPPVRVRCASPAAHGAARHGVEGSSIMPPSSPFSGRRRSSTAPSPRPSQNATPWRSGRSGFSACAGRLSAIAAAPRAAQSLAPRAQARSAAGAACRSSRRDPSAPGRNRRRAAPAPAPRRAPAAAAWRRAAASRTAKSRATTRSTLPSTAATRAGRTRSRRSPPRCSRRSRAARAAPARSSGKLPAMALDDGARAGVQVAGARVIAEPLPQMQHLVERGRGQCAKLGPARHESVKIGARPSTTVVCCSMISLSQTR